MTALVALHASTRPGSPLVVADAPGSRGRWWAEPSLLVTGVLLLLFLLPVLLVEIPAGADTPNHLARMGIMSRAGEDPHPYYEVRWALHPNLGMDLVVPPLARLVGAPVATKTFYLAGQLLVVTGAVALELARKRRVELAGPTALAVLYSLPFAWGFMNFTTGLGLALWACAAFLLLQERPWAVRVSVHAVVVAVLFLCHLFALGVYGLVVGVLELARIRRCRGTLRDVGRTTSWLAAPVVPAVGAMVLSGGGVGSARSEWSAAVKVLWLFGGLNGYSLVVSVVLSALLLVTLGAVLVRGALRTDATGALLAGVLGLAYLAIPARLLDTAYADVRVLVAAALVLPAFLHLAPLPPAGRWALRGVVGVVLVTQLVVVAVVQADYHRAHAELRSSFRLVPLASDVLVAAWEPGWTGTVADHMVNSPTLVAEARDAFVPTLFSEPGKQPLAPRAERRPLDVGDEGVMPVTLLRDVAEGRVPPGTPRVASRWTEEFDHLYVVGEPGPNPVPAHLVELDRGARFTLYEIRGSHG